ncbi:putative methyltransferase-domain-containing protein [Mortierella sp. GBAus27b]|nr:putative methyltransferase-domain-containing protein [Mortierella sp. GBAus27b]
MKECREQDSKEPLTSSEDQPLESSLSSLSISGTSAASTVTEHSHTSTPSGRHERMCLELGAGTGLVGIAVAVAFPELSVLSTDLDEAMSLMQQNVDANQHLLPNNNMKVDVLDWAEKDRQVDPVEILLLADVVYNDLSHEMLLQTMLDYSNEKTKILLGYKFRHEAEQKFFVRAKEYFDMDMVHEQDTMQLFVMTRRPN